MNIPGLLVRRRRWIAMAWVLVAALLLPKAGTVSEVLEAGVRVEGSGSAEVERLLAGPLASPFAHSAILVARGIPTPATASGDSALRTIIHALDGAPEVADTFSFLDTADSLFLVPGSSGTFVVVGLAEEGMAPDLLMPGLRRATERLVPVLRVEHPDATLRWTGETPLNVDLRETSGTDVAAAERRALPVTAGLLLLAFGAVVAALLPVVVGAMAIAIAMGAAAVVAQFVSLSLLLQSVVSMLGLGLGIDYALLMVSRFREHLVAGDTVEASAEAAARHAGHTILLSAATVALGFLVLLLVPLNEIRAVAVGGLLVVISSALLATTLVPGVLALVGTRINWGRVGRRRTSSETLRSYLDPGRKRWRTLGHWVTAHPWLALIGGATPLVLLSLPALFLQTGLPQGDWLPPSMESTVALHDLDDMGRSGIVQIVRVVLEFPEGVSGRDSDGWDAMGRMGDSLAADPRVDRVRSMVGLARSARLGRLALAVLPREITQSLLSPDGRLALFELLPNEDVTPAEMVTIVRELRAKGAMDCGVDGATLTVGGLPALNADYQNAVVGRFGALVMLVIGSTLVALFLGLRSVLVPLKAVILNLLSVTSAFGALTLVFQLGHGARFFGVSEPLEAVFSSLPIVVFCIVFGLSMDYEVFLITRVMEGRKAGLSDREAIIDALGTTGPVITSAAAIMLAVFTAFTLGEVLMIKMLGFALAVAVLVDATLVRMVIGPALLQLAGRWNWWPDTGRR